MLTKPEKQVRYSIRLTVVSVFVLATLFTATVAIGLQYYFSRGMAIESAFSQQRLTAAGTRQYLSSIDDKAEQATRILAKYHDLIQGDTVNPKVIRMFAEVMHNNPIFYAVYVGFANGDFYELVNLDTHSTVRGRLRAKEEDRWVVITVNGKGDERRRRFHYLDDSFRMRASREERSDYDASKRPWFLQAKNGRVNKSAPYLFQHLQQPGQTFSTVIPSTDAVFAVDITLSALSSYLQKQPLGPGSELYLYRHSGELIASNRENLPAPDIRPPVEPLDLSERQRRYLDGLGKLRISNEMDWSPIDFAVSGEPKGYAVDLLRMMAQMAGFRYEFVNGYQWSDLVAMFRNKELDILQPVFATEENRQLGLLSAPILKLPYAVVTRRDEPEVRRMGQLAGKTLIMPEGWSITSVIRENFPEINVLETDSNRRALMAVASGEAYATLDSAAILRHTASEFFIENLAFHENLDIGELKLPDELHLVVQPSQAGMLDIINAALKTLGPQYLQALADRWLNGGAENGRRALAVVPYPELLKWREKEGLEQLRRGSVGGRDCFVFIAEFGGAGENKEYFAAVMPAEMVLADSLDRVKMSLLATAAVLLLLLPVSWLFASPIVRPIKRLAVETEKIKNRKYDDVALTDSFISEIHDLVVSIREMAHAIRLHEQELKELMESIIRLIAQAIDDKSHYTAGHCARVPELGLMLAKAAADSDAAPFRQFRFHSDEELQEFRIAAWLHDCGKITTPEHIVDKATKLETIYNRIHEIRMRFEVLWRDAEIDFLRQSANDPQQAQVLVAELERKRAQLQDDFAFIARTNIGGESLEDGDIERLTRLSGITWRRHFDDRTGLSQIERERFEDEPPPLPATELLLGDKPEHIVKRIRSTDFDPALGIDMDIPEHLYNQGELYNLSVARGTLTAEDRFKINEHIISTIKMLESVPFPKEFARVPRYASTHHETLDGLGYPRKLSGDQLSIPERILAVADIFEALTAADRPYKEPKKISEAIEILHRMALDKHVDMDVFALFLSSGVYLEYARRFLRPEQIDTVDIDRYLESVSAG